MARLPTLATLFVLVLALGTAEGKKKRKQTSTAADTTVTHQVPRHTKIPFAGRHK